jgi:transcriptional regulator with XRE-family HTH domain
MSGHRSFRELSVSIDQDPERREQAEQYAQAIRDVLRLSELRVERSATQQDLADRMEMTQGRVSRIERETNPYLSTLRRYIEALGGELHILAQFPDGQVVDLNKLHGDVVEEPQIPNSA